MASTTRANALLWLKAGHGRVPAGAAVPALLIGPVYSAACVPPSTRAGTDGVGVDHHAHGCDCGREHPSAAPAGVSSRPQHELHGVVAGSTAVPLPPGTAPGKGPVRIRRLGVLTVSDTVAEGRGTDASGPAIVDALTRLVPGLLFDEVVAETVRDGVDSVTAALLRLADGPTACELVLTSGGTGLGVRDETPEATAAVLDRRAPGLVHAMLAFGLAKTPMAALSRYEAGVRTRRTGTPTLPCGDPRPGTLIVNFPGSPKAVRECVEALKVVLPHAVALANGL